MILSFPLPSMKPWYLSRTLLVNFLAAVAVFVQSQTGYAIPPELQAYGLVLLNMLLRTITDKELSV